VDSDFVLTALLEKRSTRSSPKTRRIHNIAEERTMARQARNGKNAIAKYLERSPLITLLTAAVALSGVLYTIISYVDSHRIETLKLEHEKKIFEYENRVAKIGREYQEKARLLEDERSRITFSVKNESAFLDLKTLFVNEGSLVAGYKRFRPLCGA
jgi:hypothetical protein